MPAIDPKSLPANLQPGAPSRNLTPQEMGTAVAELKNKPGAKGLNPDDSPVGLRPNFTRQKPTPTMRPPMRPTGPRPLMKKGGEVKGYASGGKVRGGGCEQRGKTKGRMV